MGWEQRPSRGRSSVSFLTQPLLQELCYSVWRVLGEDGEGLSQGAVLQGAAKCMPSTARFFGAGGFKLGSLVLCKPWSSVLCKQASSEANKPPQKQTCLPHPKLQVGVLLVLRLTLSLNILLSNNITLQV